MAEQENIGQFLKKCFACELKKIGLAAVFSPSMPGSVTRVRVLLCLGPHLIKHRATKMTMEARTSSVGTIITARSYSLATGRSRNLGLN